MANEGSFASASVLLPGAPQLPHCTTSTTQGVLLAATCDTDVLYFSSKIQSLKIFICNNEPHFHSDTDT